MDPRIALAFVAIFLALVAFIILIVTEIRSNKEVEGKIRVETSDPDGPYLFLELYTPVSHILSKKTVLLEIDAESIMSQK